MCRDRNNRRLASVDVMGACTRVKGCALAIDEQRRIADVLWLVHEGMIKSEREGMLSVQLLQKSLHKLMTGEIRAGGIELAGLKRQGIGR